jgi:hypothetical protein
MISLSGWNLHIFKKAKKMKPLDTNYLALQFREKIWKKNGKEFQTFFEEIMNKALSDFRKIKPYGKMGDGGNDGYIGKNGIYFQVYAPNEPIINDRAASKKFQDDFSTLQRQWDDISKITKYNFVYNDKYSGSIQLLEAAKKKLSSENPEINFNLLLAEDLERIFFSLSEADLIDLGFNTDKRQAIKMAYDYLNYIQDELEGGNIIFTQKLLGKFKNIVSALNDNKLSLEYEILECRCVQKIEDVNEAKERFRNISIRYPDDPRPLLFLAEIYLHEKDFNKNMELLQKAENINNNHWMLILEKLIRMLNCGEKIVKSELEKLIIPDDPRIQEKFYRVFALIYEGLGEKEAADSYIERALHSNSESFINYFMKLSIIKRRIISNPDISLLPMLFQKLLCEIKEVEDSFFVFRDIAPRQKALLNSLKLGVYFEVNNITEFIKIAEDTFQILLKCYFDIQTEQIFIEILNNIYLPINDFSRLLLYIKQFNMPISSAFARVLLLQFDINDSIFTEGKQFFTDLNCNTIINFIEDIENQDDGKVIAFLQENIEFITVLPKTLKKFPEFRKIIFENLPDNKDNLKIKLSILLNSDETDVDEAFNIIKLLDLSQLSYIECIPLLRIIHSKEAWDFSLVILTKLLENEKDENQILKLKLQLFTTYQNLKKFGEAINIGEEILTEYFSKKFLSPQNKEVLLAQTIISCFERGKVDIQAFGKSKTLLLSYQLENPSFEFKTAIESKVFLNNSEPEKAFESIIEGVKAKKILSPYDYAKLYFLLSVEIGNQIEINLDSLENVQENSFIKMRNKDQWYFIGTDNELDALLITESNDLYPLLIDSKRGDKLVFVKKYNKSIIDEEIEIIFPIGKYIFWQTIHHFQELTKDGVLEGVQSVDIPQEMGTLDPSYLLQFMEDQYKDTEPLFEMYCKNKLPLSILAVSEGSLINAIGKIQQENKGFINFTTGEISEIDKQKGIAKEVIDGKLPFYIDGTSALFLAESGMLLKIQSHIPNLKIPQSVITFLADIADRVHYRVGQTGSLGYSQGRITFSSIEKERRDLLQGRFISSINIFESNSRNIGDISPANKKNCFSETKIPEELCDACILAQKENIPVLTDDFIYLQMNELETSKKAPSFFSSFALIRMLYEKEQLSFEDYLDYFGYLSSYRCKFLHVDNKDIAIAVFGDKKIKSAEPKNIRRFNFPLTLSEEYGVSFKTAFTLIGSFLFGVLLDISVDEEIVEEIFIELIEALPTEFTKKDLGLLLLNNCYREIGFLESECGPYPGVEQLIKKFKRLFQIIEKYDSKQT